MSCKPKHPTLLNMQAPRDSRKSGQAQASELIWARGATGALAVPRVAKQEGHVNAAAHCYGRSAVEAWGGFTIPGVTATGATGPGYFQG